MIRWIDTGDWQPVTGWAAIRFWAEATTPAVLTIAAALWWFA